MEELKNTQEQPKKLSYSELENTAQQLSAQNHRLQTAIQELNYNNFFTRLNFLFKVVDNLDKFSKDFAEKCIKEIEDLMSLPEKTVVEEDDNKESK